MKRLSLTVDDWNYFCIQQGLLLLVKDWKFENIICFFFWGFFLIFSGLWKCTSTERACFLNSYSSSINKCLCQILVCYLHFCDCDDWQNLSAIAITDMQCLGIAKWARSRKKNLMHIFCVISFKAYVQHLKTLAYLCRIFRIKNPSNWWLNWGTSFFSYILNHFAYI